MSHLDYQESISHLCLGNIQAAQTSADQHLGDSGISRDDYWRFVFVKAECLRMRGRTREALDLIGNVIDSFVSPEVLALWKMHRGYVLGMRNRYLEAKQTFDEAEQIATENGFDQLMIEILVRRAMILFFAEDLAASRETYRKALELARQPKGLLLAGNSAGRYGKESYDSRRLSRCYQLV